MTALSTAKPAVDARANAFDSLRLAAALAVVVEHGWVLTGHRDPLPASSGSSLGQIAVGVFFLTSGFLVATSWVADPSVRRFTLRRALRIYPLYAGVIAATALVAGPLLSTLSVGEYFANTQTWLYLGRNLVVFPVDFVLPGVFHTVPLPDVVNGSLWTIRVEMLCYVGVALLGSLSLLARRGVLLVLGTAALCLAAVVFVTGYSGRLVPGLLGADAAEPLAFFAIGMLVRAARPRLALPWWSLLVVAALWFVCWNTPVAETASVLAVSCATFVVAFRAPRAVRRPTGGYDLSYGTYVLAFPIQQCYAQAGLLNPWLATLAAIATVLPLAALSWRFVERPALRHKPRRPAAPREQPVPAVGERAHEDETGVPSSTV